MGFEIPEPYCWDDSFRVFYENLDEQHKGLFKGIFNLAASKNDTGALTHLRKVVRDHFVTEEAMMKSKDYTEYGPHKKIHDEFVAKLESLHCPVDEPTIHFAKDWLVNHIKGIDFKYKGKL